MINEKEKIESDSLYLLIEFQTVIIDGHNVSRNLYIKCIQYCILNYLNCLVVFNYVL